MQQIRVVVPERQNRHERIKEKQQALLESLKNHQNDQQNDEDKNREL